MDAFEQIVSEVFYRRGYWTQTSVKVDLTKDEKVAIGRPSSPRWEIDVVAYSGAKNELLALECKSFLDSRGVAASEFDAESSSTRYKLFREPSTRTVVLKRLKTGLESAGYIAPDATTRFGLVAGKVKTGDTAALEAIFAKEGWDFWSPDWLRNEIRELASGQYSNDVSAVVAKLLLR